MEEELGIKAGKIEFLDSYQDKEPTLGLDYVHHIFIVHSWKGEPSNMNIREHESISWFEKNDIKVLKMHGEVKRIILEQVDF